MVRQLIILSLGVAIASCATQYSKEPSIDIDSFALLIENTFETVPDNTETIIRDRRVRVMSDAMDGYWFYSQLNTGVEGKIYRQRLANIKLSEDGSAIIQKTYMLKKPELFENAWENSERLSSLTDKDYDRFFNDDCEQVWTQVGKDEWRGYIDPEKCIISSKRRNMDIRIESEAYLSKITYRTNERGFDMDMNFLWGSPIGEMISLYPVP